MIIDSIEWHQGGDWPVDLPPSAAGTHIGMFFAWIILNELFSDDLAQFQRESIEAVFARALTGRSILVDKCDGALMDADLDEDAQLFVKDYYSVNAGDTSAYLEDYERTLAGGLPSLYHVHDDWNNYDLLAPVIDAAYDRWRAEQGSNTDDDGTWINTANGQPI